MTAGFYLVDQEPLMLQKALQGEIEKEKKNLITQKVNFSLL